MVFGTQRLRNWFALKALLTLTVAAACLPCLVWKQRERLSVQDAVAFALTHHPEVRASALKITAAREGPHSGWPDSQSSICLPQRGSPPRPHVRNKGDGRRWQSVTGALARSHKRADCDDLPASQSRNGERCSERKFLGFRVATQSRHMAVN